MRILVQITTVEPMITGLQQALPKSIGLLPFDGGISGKFVALCSKVDLQRNLNVSFLNDSYPSASPILVAEINFSEGAILWETVRVLTQSSWLTNNHCPLKLDIVGLLHLLLV